jgi:hypothetical protein
MFVRSVLPPDSLGCILEPWLPGQDVHRLSPFYILKSYFHPAANRRSPNIFAPSLNRSPDFPLAVSRKQAHLFSIENDSTPILHI